MPIREAFHIFCGDWFLRSGNGVGHIDKVEATSTPVSTGIGDLPLPYIILQAHSAWPSLCG